MTAPSATPDSSPDDAAPWRVVCLCAAWCGVCREWRALFDQVAAAHPELGFDWVDVEDEAEALGEVDIETFPTMLVARGNQPLFYGPIPPSASQLSRLVSSLRAHPKAGLVPAEATPLLQRLVSGVLPARWPTEARPPVL
ncbi:MAG TPA: thioredoxin family protein [Ramlibacter sp.]|nr:thioredoxin family protein [Ramlibacter sp.]